MEKQQVPQKAIKNTGRVTDWAYQRERQFGKNEVRFFRKELKTYTKKKKNEMKEKNSKSRKRSKRRRGTEKVHKHPSEMTQVRADPALGRKTM